MVAGWADFCTGPHAQERISEPDSRERPLDRFSAYHRLIGPSVSRPDREKISPLVVDLVGGSKGTENSMGRLVSKLDMLARHAAQYQSTE